MSVISLSSEDEEECVFVDNVEKDYTLAQAHQLFIQQAFKNGDHTGLDDADTECKEILPEPTFEALPATPTQDADPVLGADPFYDERNNTNIKSVWEATSKTPHYDLAVTDESVRIFSSEHSKEHIGSGIEQLTPEGVSHKNITLVSVEDIKNCATTTLNGELQNIQRAKIQCIAERLLEVLKEGDTPTKTTAESAEGARNMSNIDVTLVEVTPTLTSVGSTVNPTGLDSKRRTKIGRVVSSKSEKEKGVKRKAGRKNKQVTICDPESHIVSAASGLSELNDNSHCEERTASVLDKIIREVCANIYQETEHRELNRKYSDTLCSNEEKNKNDNQNGVKIKKLGKKRGCREAPGDFSEGDCQTKAMPKDKPQDRQSCAGNQRSTSSPSEGDCQTKAMPKDKPQDRQSCAGNQRSTSSPSPKRYNNKLKLTINKQNGKISVSVVPPSQNPKVDRPFEINSRPAAAESSINPITPSPKEGTPSTDQVKTSSRLCRNEIASDQQSLTAECLENTSSVPSDGYSRVQPISIVSDSDSSIFPREESCSRVQPISIVSDSYPSGVTSEESSSGVQPISINSDSDSSSFPSEESCSREQPISIVSDSYPSGVPSEDSSSSEQPISIVSDSYPSGVPSEDSFPRVQPISIGSDSYPSGVPSEDSSSRVQPISIISDSDPCSVERLGNVRARCDIFPQTNSRPAVGKLSTKSIISTSKEEAYSTEAEKGNPSSRLCRNEIASNKKSLTGECLENNSSVPNEESSAAAQTNSIVFHSYSSLMEKLRNINSNKVNRLTSYMSARINSRSADEFPTNPTCKQSTYAPEPKKENTSSTLCRNGIALSQKSLSAECLENICSGEPSATAQTNSTVSDSDPSSVERLRNVYSNEVRSSFVQCYNTTFDESGEYICVKMGDLLLLAMEEARNYKARLMGAGKLTCERLRAKEEMLALYYYQSGLKQYRCTFGEQFCKIYKRIFNDKIIYVQYRALLVAWFLKLFLRVTSLCPELSGALHEARTNVIALLPFSMLLIPIVRSVFMWNEAVFEQNCWLVLDFMRDCIQSNGNHETEVDNGNVEEAGVIDTTVRVNANGSMHECTSASQIRPAEHNLRSVEHDVCNNDDCTSNVPHGSETCQRDELSVTLSDTNTSKENNCRRNIHCGPTPHYLEDETKSKSPQQIQIGAVTGNQFVENQVVGDSAKDNQDKPISTITTFDPLSHQDRRRMLPKFDSQEDSKVILQEDFVNYVIGNSNLSPSSIHDNNLFEPINPSFGITSSNNSTSQNRPVKEQDNRGAVSYEEKRKRANVDKNENTLNQTEVAVNMCNSYKKQKVNKGRAVVDHAPAASIGNTPPTTQNPCCRTSCFTSSAQFAQHWQNYENPLCHQKEGNNFKSHWNYKQNQSVCLKSHQGINTDTPNTYTPPTDTPNTYTPNTYTPPAHSHCNPSYVASNLTPQASLSSHCNSSYVGSNLTPQASLSSHCNSSYVDFNLTPQASLSSHYNASYVASNLTPQASLSSHCNSSYVGSNLTPQASRSSHCNPSSVAPNLTPQASRSSYCNPSVYPTPPSSSQYSQQTQYNPYPGTDFNTESEQRVQRNARKNRVQDHQRKDVSELQKRANVADITTRSANYLQCPYYTSMKASTLADTPCDLQAARESQNGSGVTINNYNFTTCLPPYCAASVRTSKHASCDLTNPKCETRFALPTTVAALLTPAALCEKKCTGAESG